VLDYTETEPRTMDGTERILALDEETGDTLWSHEWPTTYRMLMFTYATGPRATPTVDGDRVYVVGATGRILCLRTETGEVVWEKDTVLEYDTSIPVWGTSSAALIEGDLVIFLVGGEPDGLVMAFDKYTGDEVWRALESRTEMGYNQPIVIDAGGARQLIVWHPRGLSSLDPATGDLYWEEPFDGRANMTVADAVRSGSYLLVSGFYSGSMMMRLDLDRPAATTLWKGQSNRVLDGGIEVAET
jgi:outer membrane protein assembly factor BamB